MRALHDVRTDAISVWFSGEHVEKSVKVRPDLILDYNCIGQIVGMKILNAKKNLEKDPDLCRLVEAVGGLIPQRLESASFSNRR